MQKITLIINKTYFSENTAKVIYFTTYGNLFLRVWNFFKTFKGNITIKTMSIDIKFEKWTMSCLFKRFIAYYACSRPITYELSIYGNKYNFRTIKNGLKYQIKVFGAVTGLSN